MHHPKTPLPFRILPLQKRLQNRNNLHQRTQPRLQLTLHLRLTPLCPQLRIKVLTVRTRAHRSAENRLHHEGMVRFERVAVGGAEGG